MYECICVCGCWVGGWWVSVWVDECTLMLSSFPILIPGFMSLCSQRTPSQADSLPVTATRATLPLYQNLITFESIHGRGEAAGTKLLRELLSASPVLPEVWLVCATEEGRRGEGWREVVKRGVRLCHGFSSELYYFAARKELSQV